MAPRPARLLDLTRLVSRLGRGPLTGIDRVEAAYLDHLSRDSVPLWGLVRSAAGFLLLDGRGLSALRAMLRGESVPGAPDLLGRLLLRGDPQRARVEATLRRVAAGRALRLRAGALLSRLPRGTSYLNVGHANLSAGLLAAMARAGLQRTVLIHDTIPLDHPGFARPGIPAVFGRKLAAAAEADLVIHTAEATRATTERHFAALGRMPGGVVAPLGLDPPVAPDPATPCPPGAFFLCLGTVEPRKNHALLLDVWDLLPAVGRPVLIVAGHRGWADPALLARLDRTPGVEHRPGLSDAAVAHLMTAARALLFPSLAEGYGLPPLEAARVGLPVVCAPLPVLAERLGDYPVYHDPRAPYPWAETVQRLARTPERWSALAGPAWEDHFKMVLTLA